MTFGSVCSGIEAASVAWHPLGWRCAFVSEIEPFPCAVLRYYWPDAPNYGDLNECEQWPARTIDILVGGTPCQDFSVAGQRAGMAGARGNLTLRFLDAAARYTPRWVVWENVPGVLSIDEGRAFGTFLGGLAKLGYGFAYRVLDAQYFGVAQRRERVFVVGHSGGAWGCAAAVLFDAPRLRWNPAPRREARQRIAPTVAGCAGRSGANDFATSGALVSGTIAASGAGTERPAGQHNEHDFCVIAPCVGSSGRGFERAGETRGQDCVIPVSMARNAKAGTRLDGESETFIVHSLTSEGFDASEDGTGRGTPLVYEPHHDEHDGRGANFKPTDCSPSIRGPNGTDNPLIAFSCKDNGRDAQRDIAALRANGPGHDPVGTRIRSGMAVRRLTPREVERLFGFPDDYTLIPYRGKPACDGPRYRALGNSMAVPVMRWIGRRIQLVDSILKSQIVNRKS